MNFRNITIYESRNKKRTNVVLDTDLCNGYDDQKDYSIISQFAPKDVSGKCVYCNHCKPCPQSLDIGLINKYYEPDVHLK